MIEVAIVQSTKPIKFDYPIVINEGMFEQIQFQPEEKETIVLEEDGEEVELTIGKIVFIRPFTHGESQSRLTIRSTDNEFFKILNSI